LNEIPELKYSGKGKNYMATHFMGDGHKKIMWEKSNKF
jgi:hypothetical protein